MKFSRIAATPMAALAVAALVLGFSVRAEALPELRKTEAKCTNSLAKGAAKLVQTIAADTAKCLISNPAGSCPDEKTAAKIAKGAEKLVASANKSCVSTCSISGVTCVDDIFCPPNGASVELCTAGVKNKPMSLSNIGFPGALCPDISNADGLASCVSDIGIEVGNNIISNVVGGIDGGSGLSDDAAKCLGSVSKAMGKTSAKIAKTVSKCLDKVNLSDPAPDELVTVTTLNCQEADEKTASGVAKALEKLSAEIAKRCTSDLLAELDICGAGVGGIATIEDAQACLLDVALEAGSTTELAGTREFIPFSIINAAYPASLPPFCGDGRINPIRNQFALIGEECDGDNDDACPSACLPPGDAFECTCSTTPRARRFVDGFAARLDSGWTGLSQSANVPDRAGFIVDLTDCDCAEFDPVDTATCVSSLDPICNQFAQMEPRCSWGVELGDVSCDAFGDGDGIHEDTDCALCDAFASNPGDPCAGESDCDSQCYDAGGSPTGPCVRQNDCTGGDICKGRCDSTPYCVKITNGAPLPLSSSGTQTCVLSEFFSDVTGTGNIQTGEHAINYELRSKVFLASKQTRPCPVCGGYCFGGDRNGEICEGTCADTKECRFGTNDGTSCTTDGDCTGGGECWGLSCRFDSDCPGEDSCTSATPTCAGAPCQLDLICSGGFDEGKACRIEAFTAFGATSVDCQPILGTGISGEGLKILFTPSTSEVVTLPEPAPCDAPGYGNFDCNCVRGTGSTRTRPNRCAASCDAGAEFGQGCATNNTGNGLFTTCAGGANIGQACDENDDCPGSTCSANPLHCTAGDPAKLQNSCSTDADCDTTGSPGDGVCGDACPSGRCVPLCLPLGQCDGGPSDGLNCADDEDCGGNTCVVVDDETGACSAGQTFHCSGDFSFVPCLPSDRDTTVGCGDDIPGAGLCVEDVNKCLLPGGTAEGGDTFNGNGDPTNFYTVAAYCVPSTSSSAVNSTAGLPGPGRLRQGGTSVMNSTSF